MTFLTYQEQLNLVEKGLATVKVKGDISVFKYSRKVMYDYLWDDYPELLECRGHAYNNKTGELIIAAPRKSFNYLENNNWANVPLDTKVTMYKKFNGFMATLTVYNDEILIGTTGTTDSDYAKMAREMILKIYGHNEAAILKWPKDVTYLFEICHPDDPHIVHENPGAVYLGCRAKVDDVYMKKGEFFPVLDNFEDYHPSVTLKEAIEITNNVKHEGFMVYDEHGNVCKMKSPYYVGKKKLMRSRSNFIEQLWNEKGLDTLPEMWHDVVRLLIRDVWEADWRAMSDQERRKVLESYEQKGELCN